MFGRGGKKCYPWSPLGSRWDLSLVLSQFPLSRPHGITFLSFQLLLISSLFPFSLFPSLLSHPIFLTSFLTQNHILFLLIKTYFLIRVCENLTCKLKYYPSLKQIYLSYLKRNPEFQKRKIKKK